MRKLPLVIIGCVVVFLSVVVGLLLAKSRGPKLQPPEPAQSRADYRIKEVHLQEEDRGARWQLDAEYGEIFEAQGKTVMKKVTIRISEPNREWTVSGDEGELTRDTKDVELRGNVIVVSSDGLRLETKRLNWTAKEQRAWTSDPVLIRRGGVVVSGQGFESRINEEATMIKGRVRATITGGPNALGGRRS
ncbi:MAG TPA: LPS export ABC transporter periplasmic protein LptC [Methylomirabilota bacterium]|jgi:LPS export ABC transporter protein LptC|nr:LPS export ABC transporter periplasmic protein LptC [Methylomirabilota bacterium]